MPFIKNLIGNKEQYIQVLNIRKTPENIIESFKQGTRLYAEWNDNGKKIQDLRTERNKLSKEYGKKKEEAILRKAEKIKKEIENLEKRQKECEEKLRAIELMLPNWLAEDVPREENGSSKPIEYFGVPKVLNSNVSEFEKRYPDVQYIQTDEVLHHYDLVGKLIEQDIAGEIAGSRFYCEFDELVILDFALTMYALEFFRKKGYANRLLITPYLMKKSVEEKITYFTSFADTIFELEKDGLVLIPSSEHTIVAFYSDKIFEEKELPLRVMAWSPCFRKEAGAHGKDTKGIFRAKQFHKLEIHSIMPQDDDLDEVERIRKDVQEFMFSLGLPNRSVIVHAADTDMRALKQVDVETWMPGQNQYRETHSIATMGTWVSEKVKMRYTTKSHERLPTNNVYATAVANQRTICAIVENHYSPKEKAIQIPKPLQKYTFGVDKIKL
ncbi:MAG: aminoacyl--tRNA ligase-related protein [Candidatus Diapherotrites archaeon]